MTVEEKGNALVEMFMKPIDPLHKYPMCFDTAKQCAIISVQEIQDALQEHDDTVYDEYSYWEQLKNRIQSL